MKGLIHAAAVTLLIAPAAFAEDAAAIFKAKCAMCHGADGSGQTSIGKSKKIRDLRSPEVQKQTDKEIYEWISDGKGKKSGFKNKLSEAEINSLVAYVRGLARK